MRRHLRSRRWWRPARSSRAATAWQWCVCVPSERHRRSEQEQTPVASWTGVLRGQQTRDTIDEVPLDLPQPVLVDIEAQGAGQVALPGLESLLVLLAAAAPIVDVRVIHRVVRAEL